MINHEAFVKWCEEHFDKVIVKGNEVKINSIFAADTKCHMWCNTAGGKHQREDGCYRCFYTETVGTLVGLVMQVDSCTYSEAKEILSGLTSLRVLEEKLDKMFEEKQQNEIINSLALPKHCQLIEHSPEAKIYLEGRKLPFDNLFFCTNGEYKNRIIIPYYDKNGKLIYFNSRHIGNSTLRYLGPPKSCGVGKSDVLYATKWPKKGKVYITEGEFDALALSLCGFDGMACGGKTMSDQQVEMIREYKVCIALDTDQAGYQGLLDMGNKLLRNGISLVSYVRPPQGFKDWNKMLMQFNIAMIQAYINTYEKPFDQWTGEVLAINRL